MTATAAHLALKVFPDVAVRQWVLSLPYELRGLLAAKAPVLSCVLRLFLLNVAAPSTAFWTRPTDAAWCAPL